MTGDELMPSLGSIGHDLATPLTAVRNAVRIVRDGDAGPVAPDQARFLDLALANVERAGRLVDDLQDAVGAAAGTLGLRRRPVDLACLVREAVDSVLLGRGAGAAVDLDGVPDGFEAWADPDRCVRIVANLVGNALKHTEPGTGVAVHLAEGAAPAGGLARRLARGLGVHLRGLVLTVSDRGDGLGARDVEALLRPFVRGGDAGERPGSGLGLHVVRTLSELHGGGVRLASRPGQGTAVMVSLPRDEASANLILGARRLEREAARFAGAAHPVTLDVRSLPHDHDEMSRWVQACAAAAGENVRGGPVHLAAAVHAALVADVDAWQAGWRDAAPGVAARWCSPAANSDPTRIMNDPG